MPAPLNWPARAAQIEQWRASGLSLRQWAQQHHLSHATLTYWLKHLRQPPQKPTRNKRTDPPLKLTAVQIAPSAAMADTGHASILVCSPSGWQITLPGSLGIEQLALLLKSLP